MTEPTEPNRPIHPIRILLLDDHVLFREGLSRLLAEEPGFLIAAQCSSGDEALQALEAGLQADLILLDFDLGEQTGFAFLTRARAAGYRGQVLMVTAGMAPSDTVKALDAGASGLFLKHAPPRDLIQAIHAAMRGEALLSSSAMASLFEAARLEEARRGPPLQLTDRERAVLRGVFAGLANKEIGAKLDISEGYVKAVLQQLFGKTGVRTRAQLVRIALEHNFHMPLEEDRPRPAKVEAKL